LGPDFKDGPSEDEGVGAGKIFQQKNTCGSGILIGFNTKDWIPACAGMTEKNGFVT